MLCVTPQGPPSVTRPGSQGVSPSWCLSLAFLLFQVIVLLLEFQSDCLCPSTGPPAAPTPPSHPCFRRGPITSLQCISQPSPEKQNPQDIEGKRFILRSWFVPLSGLTSPKPAGWAVGPETQPERSVPHSGFPPNSLFCQWRESGEHSAEEQGPWSWSSEPQVAVGPRRKLQFPRLPFPLL